MAAVLGGNSRSIGITIESAKDLRAADINGKFLNWNDYK
jgi:hypothetical protein